MLVDLIQATKGNLQDCNSHTALENASYLSRLWNCGGLQGAREGVLSRSLLLFKILTLAIWGGKDGCCKKYWHCSEWRGSRLQCADFGSKKNNVQHQGSPASSSFTSLTESVAVIARCETGGTRTGNCGNGCKGNGNNADCTLTATLTF